MINKTTANPDDNRNVLAIFVADRSHQMPDHLFDRMAVVGMLAPAAKDRIDDLSVPFHLQRL
jgi:hypothetical protein